MDDMQDADEVEEKTRLALVAEEEQDIGSCLTVSVGCSLIPSWAA